MTMKTRYFVTRDNYSVIMLRGDGPFVINEYVVKDPSELNHVKDPSDVILTKSKC